MSQGPKKVTRIHVTPHFERAFRKLPSSLQKTAIEREKLFKKDPFNPVLKAHPLKGKLKNLWSYSVDYRHRILFEFIHQEEILYHDIGSHAIYR